MSNQSKWIIFSDPSDIPTEYLRYLTPKEITERNLFSSIKFKDIEDNDIRKLVYIQTPNLKLGNLIWTSDGAYLELYPDCQSTNVISKQFIQSINLLDLHHISAIRDHWHKWFKNAGEQPKLVEIEQYFLPTLKISPVTLERDCLKIKIPYRLLQHSKKQINSLDVELYDQEKDILPTAMLKPGYSAKGLLHLSGIKKDGDYFKPIWELRQLKVEIPEKIFDKCELSADSDDEEEKNSEPKLIWDFLEDHGGIIQDFEFVE